MAIKWSPGCLCCPGTLDPCDNTLTISSTLDVESLSTSNVHDLMQDSGDPPYYDTIALYNTKTEKHFFNTTSPCYAKWLSGVNYSYYDNFWEETRYLRLWIYAEFTASGLAAKLECQLNQVLAFLTTDDIADITWDPSNPPPGEASWDISDTSVYNAQLDPTQTDYTIDFIASPNTNITWVTNYTVTVA